MADDDRIRWRCRRGLLELDLILSKFLNNRYRDLTSRQKAVFAEILTYSDHDLWDLLNGRSLPADPEIGKLIKLFE